MSKAFLEELPKNIFFSFFIHSSIWCTCIFLFRTKIYVMALPIAALNVALVYNLRCLFFTVWQKLEEENSEFFRAYYIRLKLKKQIILFNHLLEHQYHLMKYPIQPKVPLPPIQNGIHPVPGNLFGSCLCFY